MKATNSIHESIIGHSIMKCYRIKKPSSTFMHEDGLGELEWFPIIIETNSGKKYNLEEDNLEYWNSNEPLIELKTTHLHNHFNKKITAVIIDKEYGGIYLKLENDYLIYHDTSMGSEIMIEKEEEILDQNGNLK